MIKGERPYYTGNQRYNYQSLPERTNGREYNPIEIEALALDTLTSKFVALERSLHSDGHNPNLVYNEDYERMKAQVADQQKIVMGFSPAKHQAHLNSLVTELNNARELRPYNGVEITLLERRVAAQQGRVHDLSDNRRTSRFK